MSRGENPLYLPDEEETASVVEKQSPLFCNRNMEECTFDFASVDICLLHWERATVAPLAQTANPPT